MKTDIAAVRTDLQADIKIEIAESEARVQAKIDQLQADTKADIAGVRTEIANVRAELKTDIAGVHTEIADVRAELKIDIGGLEARLYRQLWIMAAGIVGLTVALVKLLG